MFRDSRPSTVSRPAEFRRLRPPIDHSNMTRADDPTRKSPPSDVDERLMAILEECYVIIEDGGRPDLDIICKASPDLRSRVESLLSGELAVIDRVRNSATDEDGEAEDGPKIVGYRILSKIGSGGMGEVYGAVEPALGREVAIKVVARRGNDESALRRLKREAAIAGALDHSNIVPVYAVGESEDFAWIAMKRLTGPSLAKLDRRLSTIEAATIGASIARALHAAHIEGVVHRDVKPANVVLDDGIAYLCDFGLARALDRSSMTVSNVVPGTLPYMAPEQLDGSRSAEPRTDIYGLCATLYEIVAGRPPFAGTTPENLVHQILHRDPTVLGVASKDRDFETIVRRGLEKSPQRRFLTAEALAEDLERFARGEPVESRPPGFIEKSLRRLRRRPRTAAAIGALAVLLVGTWIWIVATNSERRRFDRVQLDRARQAADLGENRRARDILDELEWRSPRTEGLDKERRRQAALASIDDLVDSVQTFSKDFAATIDERKREVLRLGGDKLRRPLSDFAIVAAAVMTSRLTEAREVLDRVERDFGASRSTEAFRRLIEDGRLRSIETLPAARNMAKDFDFADDHIFTSVAMKHAGCSISTRTKEIDAALRYSSRRYRTRYARGKLYHDNRQFDAAYETWSGLIDERVDRPIINENLATEAMALGRPDLAKAHLRSVAPGGRRRETVRRGIEVLRYSATWEQYRSGLEEAVAGDPADTWLHLHLGLRLLEERDFDDAEVEFETVVAGERPPSQLRYSAELGLFLIESQRSGLLDFPTARAPDHLVDELTHALDDLSDLIAKAPDSARRSDAFVISARLKRALGRPKDAWDDIDRALRDDPENPGAQSARIAETAFRCLRLIQTMADPLSPGAADLDTSIEIARALCFEITRKDRSGMRVPTPSQIDAAYESSLYFALPSRDLQAFRTAEELLRQHRAKLTPELESSIREMSTYLLRGPRSSSLEGSNR